MNIGRRTGWACFVWGWAEAVFFFVVPDVYLSRLALADMYKAWVGIFLALLGALTGGAVMYCVGMYNYQEGLAFLDNVPGISGDMIHAQRNLIQEKGMFLAFMNGALNGVPVKIFSLHSGNLGQPLVLFMIATFFSRLIRFCAVTGTTRILAVHLSRYFSLRALYFIHAACWAGFYVFYFSKVGL